MEDITKDIENMSEADLKKLVLKQQIKLMQLEMDKINNTNDESPKNDKDKNTRNSSENSNKKEQLLNRLDEKDIKNVEKALSNKCELSNDELDNIKKKTELEYQKIETSNQLKMTKRALLIPLGLIIMIFLYGYMSNMSNTTTGGRNSSTEELEIKEVEPNKEQEPVEQEDNTNINNDSDNKDTGNTDGEETSFKQEVN